jgi:excinuclease ABC subunit A
MGPEGGESGGEIIAQGTPENISTEKNSFTGQFLKEIIGTNKMKKTA